MKTLLMNLINTKTLITVVALTILYLANPVQAIAAANDGQPCKKHSQHGTNHYGRPSTNIHIRNNCDRVEFSALETGSGKQQRTGNVQRLTVKAHSGLYINRLKK